MMTVPQKKYFCNRIDEIVAEKINELKDISSGHSKDIAMMGLAQGKIQYPTIDIVKTAINRELDNGKNHGWGGGSLCSIEIEKLLIGFEEFRKSIDSQVTDENTFIRKQRNKINAEATRIKDVAMFGSEEAAHAMLKEFVEWETK